MHRGAAGSRKARHAAMPQAPPNPAWKRSAPREAVITVNGRQRRVVEVDAMTLADAADWYRVAGVEPAR